MAEENWNEMDDQTFINLFLDHELSYESMEELDRRLLDKEFKKKYNKLRLEKYNTNTENTIKNYAPMVGFIILIFVGIVLIYISAK